MLSIGSLDDEALIGRYRSSRDSADASRWLNELFERYHTRVAAWCLRITGDREMAADLAQEVFLKAYQHLDSFLGNSRFSTWLYSIARNHCYNYIKSSARRPVEAAEEVLMNLPDTGTSGILDLLEKESDERRSMQIINSVLDEVEKKVMFLHFGEDLSIDSITRLLDLKNASGAKAYIISAKRKIQRALERDAARRRS